MWKACYIVLFVLVLSQHFYLLNMILDINFIYILYYGLIELIFDSYFNYINFNCFSVLVRYVKGQRHMPYLIIDNHKYIKHRSSQTATYWKCHLYDSGVCKARLTTHYNQTLKLTATHNHNPYERFQNLEIINKEVYNLLN